MTNQMPTQHDLAPTERAPAMSFAACHAAISTLLGCPDGRDWSISVNAWGDGRVEWECYCSRKGTFAPGHNAFVVAGTPEELVEATARAMVGKPTAMSVDEVRT